MDASEIKDKEQIASKDVHAEAMTRFSMVESREQVEREAAIEDMRFAQIPDSQWDDFATKQRNDRPRYTINKIAATIDTIVGEQRENDITIKYRPSSSGAQKEVANTFNGLTRNIESQSSARSSYDRGFDEALNGGYGGWRVTTQFSDDDGFEQDIRIKPIKSAASSLWFDPGAEEYAKQDALWAFLTKDMEKSEFLARFPDATVTDFQQPQYANSICRNWFRGDVVRVAEYWRKVPITRNIVLLSDGRTIDKDEDGAILDELASQGITVVRERSVKTWKVERYLMNGAEILKGPEDWAGKFIPLIPMFGKTMTIEGREYVRGMVRLAKDAQRIYNYSTSTIVETAALAPKDPYWMTPKQAQGHEGRLRNMNVDNSPVMFYNEDPSSPGAPKRTGAPQVQSALIGITAQAQQDITATLGVTASSNVPTAGTDLDTRSGKAIIEGNRKGDTGTFVFFDNLIKSIQHTGTILGDLIPRIYDTERQVRVIQPDGTEEFVTINQTVQDQQTLEPVIVNDLSQGKYDVAIDTGPAFATRRLEAADRLIRLAEGSTMFAELTPDLIAKNLDTPGSDELHDRLRQAMIQQGKVQPTDEEVQELGLGQPAEPSQAEVLASQEQQARTNLFLAQAADLQANAQLKGSQAQLNQARAEAALADANKKDFDANKVAVEAEGKNLENIEKQADLGLPLTVQDHDKRIGQGDMVELSQEELSPGGTSEQQLNQILLNQALRQQ